MLRVAKFVPGLSAHMLTCRTYEQMPVLVEHADLTVPALHPHANRPPYHLIAWCVLPDHFHLLVDPCRQPLGDIVDTIKFTFSWFYRVRTGHRGPVWEPRFEKARVLDDHTLLETIDSIESDAVRHGLVSEAGEYHYSSLYERAAKMEKERLGFEV